MVMNDEELMSMIEQLTNVFEDRADQGIHPVSVASVMLAVAIKQLRKGLDDNEFNAIMEDLTENQFSEWENLTDEELDDLLQDLDTENKKVIH
jgi:hypothetical protein|tara:strand:+ start:33 stop:311 length:279 start_codon:yes stop_codon:yes gene_type:complete